MNFRCLSRSTSLTVGFDLAIERNMSFNETTGSSNLSLGTSNQDISIAPASPGEHGVNKSYSMIDGSLRDGPETCQVTKK